MLHFASSILATLVIFNAQAQAEEQAQALPHLGRFPIEPSVMGKEVEKPGGCSPGGFQLGTELKIKSWGVFFSPLFQFPSACQEEIIFVYTKLNRPAMVYYRPLANPKFFARSHPKLFKKFENQEYVEFPCHRVPVRKLHVWKNRAAFVALLKKATNGVEYIRQLDCSSPEHYWHPNQTFSWTQLQERIRDDRVATAALTYLYNLGYSNFVGV